MRQVRHPGGGRAGRRAGRGETATAVRRCARDLAPVRHRTQRRHSACDAAAASAGRRGARAEARQAPARSREARAECGWLRGQSTPRPGRAWRVPADDRAAASRRSRAAAGRRLSTRAARTRRPTAESELMRALAGAGSQAPASAARWRRAGCAVRAIDVRSSMQRIEASRTDFGLRPLLQQDRQRGVEAFGTRRTNVRRCHVESPHRAQAQLTGSVASMAVGRQILISTQVSERTSSRRRSCRNCLPDAAARAEVRGAAGPPPAGARAFSSCRGAPPRAQRPRRRRDLRRLVLRRAGGGSRAARAPRRRWSRRTLHIVRGVCRGGSA